MDEYEVLVIGSGPAGQKAAIAAAKLGRRAAVVERADMLGGVCVNTGTIPSKTMREAVLHLTGLRHREHYGNSYRVKEDITVQDLGSETRQVVAREMDVVRDQLARNRVALLTGSARFVDPHTVAVTGATSREWRAHFDTSIIAVGTRPARPPSVNFDGRTVVDSDGVLTLERVPGSLIVVGAGVIGIEYASVFAALGTKVTVVETRPTMLDFCDEQVVEALRYHLRDLSVTFRFGDTVAAVDTHAEGTLTTLASGKKIAADTVVYSAGRQGATEALALEAAGLAADERGRIKVDESFRTEVEHIYAVGDVIGFPALAATSMEQGRRAAYNACGEPTHRLDELYPIGIYTIPEISFVGRTERDLTDAQVPYEVGLARYRELARGQIVGDSYGLLKLLVAADDRRILGVHVFGTAATEIVHLGQALMATGGTVDYLVDAVFNYPTLTEAYKVAALDATNKLRTLSRLTSDVSGGA
ncbi:MAG TPA: Si-specific NAD(P)(+) transhydrogenase [Acidimicrobiia bacterium]|nr:Si-specific NAD(P)(+) transhydrogenase [Acidimicrobiia bacterium]